MCEDLSSKSVADVDSAESLLGALRSTLLTKTKKYQKNNLIKESDVDLLVQDASIRLFERFKKAQNAPDLKVAAFLSQLATQTVSNERRYRCAQRRDFRRTVSMNNTISHGSSIEFSQLFADPRHDGDLIQLRLDVKGIMGKLSQDQRTLCSLVGRYNIAEVCRKTDLTRPEVEKRLKKLRPFFQEFGVG